MPTLGSKVKHLVIKHRPGNFPWSNASIPLETLTGESKPAQTVQISKEITDGLPQELYECILYFVQDDLQTLQACSIVCRGWKQLCDRFKEPLRCVALHEKTNLMLYGTARGIYYRDMTKPKDSPCMMHRIADILQLDILDRPSDDGGPMAIWRSARHVYMTPLRHLDHRASTKFGEKAPQPTGWEGTCDFYAIGVLDGLNFLAAVNGKERILVKIGENGFERDCGSNFTLNPIAVCFIRDTVITALSNGLKTMEYPSRAGSYIGRPGNMPPGITNARPLIVTHGIRKRDGKNYTLVCFREFAMFTTDDWVFVGQAIVWTFLPEKIYFQDEYIFVVSARYLEIRHMFKKDVKRTLPGKFRFLSSQNADKAVVIRENGYIFGLVAGNDDLEEEVITDDLP